MDPLELRAAFLFRDARKVTKTGELNLHGNRYRAPGFLVGQTVEVRYDPFDLSILELWFNGQYLAQAVPVHLTTGVRPGLSPEPTPARPTPATGVDYLALLRQERERLVREQLPPIPFTALGTPREPEV